MQNDHGTQFDLAGIGTAGITGTTKLYDLSISNVQMGQDIHLERGTVGNTSLHAASLLSTQLMTISNGMIDLSAIDGTHGLMDFTAPATTQSLLAIDSRDALLALKMANGTITSASLDNNLQWVAADVNHSGTVSIMDSWLILRELIGLGNGSVGQWQMLDATAATSTLDAQHAWLPGIDNVNLVSGTQIDLVGVIRGDVDGSWGGM